MDKDIKSFGKFAQIEYVRPDYKGGAKKIKEIIKKMKKANTYAEFEEGFSECEKIILEISSMATVSYIRSTLDLTDKFYEEEEKFNNKESGALSIAMLNLMKTVSSSKFRKEIEENYGSFLLKDLEMSQKVMSPKIILLQVKEGMLKAIPLLRNSFSWYCYYFVLFPKI